MTPTLNVVGCGHLGQTLAALWQREGSFHIQDVLTRSVTSARAAVDFIGAGTPRSELAKMKPADFWLIAVGDDQLASSAKELATIGLVDSQTCVFHCSGFHSSTSLKALSSQTERLVSIHPVHSFAVPERSMATFAGSYCAVEGNTQNCRPLLNAFENIGGHCITIETQHKALYHAGPVFACNYLTALVDAGLECLQTAGVDEQDARGLLGPLMHRTVDNILASSPAEALTGPIARADLATVVAQHQALQQHSGKLADLYAELGQRAADIALQKSGSITVLSQIKSYLEQKHEQ